MYKKIVHFFDKLEDNVRYRLSRHPIVYALIGGVGIVLFWRGVWLLADDIGLGHIVSLVVSITILLLTGTFVWFFIGEQILISGLKEEKRLDQRTEKEIETRFPLIEKETGRRYVSDNLAAAGQGFDRAVG